MIPPKDDPEMHKVVSEDPDDGFVWKHEDDITEEDALFGGASEPSDGLKDAVGTRQANALAEAGLTTVEEALGYEGDITELDGVGEATAEDLLEAADE